MQTINGKLEKAKRLFGILGDLKLVIDGKSYYGRTRIDRGEDYKLKTLRRNIGQSVELEFEERTTGYDRITDRLLLISWGIPEKYREILKIKIKN